MFYRFVTKMVIKMASRRFNNVTVYRDKDDRWTFWIYDVNDEILAAFIAKRLSWVIYQ